MNNSEDEPSETNRARDECRKLLEQVEVTDGWNVLWNSDTLIINYKAVPLKRLQRRSWPGIEINFIGGMWMLSSHDNIGDGLGIEHQGIVNHGKTVDCQHLDDTQSAVNHGMDRIERLVGEELDDGHVVRGWPHA